MSSGFAQRNEGQYTPEMVVYLGTLIDDIKNEDANKRRESMDHIVEIAEAIGPERTKDELLPFLISTRYDDEPVLSSFAKALPQLLRFIGVESGLAIIMKALEGILLLADREVVKVSCFNALEQILPNLSDEMKLSTAYPIILMLLKSQYFSEVVTGLMLFPLMINTLISSAHDLMIEAFTIILNHSNNPNVIVRERVSLCIATCLKAANKKGSYLITNCEQTYNILEALVMDSNDGVSQRAEEAIIKFVIALYNETTTKNARLIFQSIAKILEVAETDIIVDDGKTPIPNAFIRSNSWRFRYVFVSKLNKIFIVLLKLDDLGTIKDIISTLYSFLVDIEGEVRCAAMDILPKLYSILLAYKERNRVSARIDELIIMFQNKVRDALSVNISDNEQFVKKHAAIAIPRLILANYDGIERFKTDSEGFALELASFRSELFSLVEQLLKDPDSKIRTRLILCLAMMKELIPIMSDLSPGMTGMFKTKTGTDIFLAMVTSIELLSRHDEWRLRKSMLDTSRIILVEISKVPGTSYLEKRTEALMDVLINALTDKTNVVREEAADSFSKLEPKIVRLFLPKILQFKGSIKFNIKIITLRLFLNIYLLLGQEVEKDVKEIIQLYACDKCVNVRIATAIFINHMMTSDQRDKNFKISEGLIEVFKEALRLFTTDLDVDVRSYSLWKW